MQKPAKVYLMVILSMLFWGMAFVWFKIIVQYYNPITIIFLRSLISGALILFIIWLTKRLDPVGKEDRKWFLLLAFFQPFCYFLGESYGLTKVSSTNAAVIISTIPVLSPVAAYYFFKETISRSTAWGVFFSFVGIIIMLLNPNLSFNADLNGIALLFFAVFSAIAYSLIIRKLANKYKPITIIAIQNIIGAIFFLPLFLMFELNSFLSVKPNTELLLSLFQLSIFGSTLAFIFYVASIRELGITRANIFSNLIPVFTAIASYFILKEQFTIIKIFGMTIVMAGVVISQGKMTINLFTRK